MPTYDYQCNKCNYTFEQFQSFSDDSLKICPQCNADSLRRLISAGTGIIFKGSGFYVTDSRSAASGKKSSVGNKSNQSGAADQASNTSQPSSAEGKKDPPVKKSDGKNAGLNSGAPVSSGGKASS